VYYFKGYFAAAKTAGEPVSFAVPTGNFGNVLAGHIARTMGLPIGRLILATNENDVMHEFFRTGRYRVRKAAEVHATSSPSMDISKASNFERYVFDLMGRDGRELAHAWKLVEGDGLLDLSRSDAFRRIGETGFVSGSSRHEERIATIHKVWRDHGVMIDTHTADGVKVALELREPNEVVVCLETAQPVKFAASIKEALGQEPQPPKGYEDLEKKPQRFEVMDNDAAAVKQYIERHALA
jgi:threonine synthase